MTIRTQQTLQSRLPHADFVANRSAASRVNVVVML